MVNPPLYQKLIATGVCSLVAIVLYLINRKSKTRLLCMVAMLLCTLGDLFMTNTFKINSMLTTIIGAASFMAGHLFYSNMFYVLSKQKGGKFINQGFIIGLVIGFLPLVIMEIVAITTVQNPEVLYLAAVPVYVAIITLHISANFSYAWKLKNWRSIILVAAVTLFYVTDIWIFIGMFNLLPHEAAKDLEHCIWHFYPLAQLCLIIFSESIAKKALTSSKKG